MKRVTLYWDDENSGLFYNNGTKWRFRPDRKRKWRDCMNQCWLPIDFKKSLTVNNFKEK